MDVPRLGRAGMKSRTVPGPAAIGDAVHVTVLPFWDVDTTKYIRRLTLKHAIFSYLSTLGFYGKITPVDRNSGKVQTLNITHSYVDLYGKVTRFRETEVTD